MCQTLTTTTHPCTHLTHKTTPCTSRHCPRDANLISTYLSRKSPSLCPDCKRSSRSQKSNYNSHPSPIRLSIPRPTTILAQLYIICANLLILDFVLGGLNQQGPLRRVVVWMLRGVMPWRIGKVVGDGLGILMQVWVLGVVGRWWWIYGWPFTVERDVIEVPRKRKRS